MTSDSGNIDARAESIRNLQIAETLLASTGDRLSKRDRVELHTRIAAVWSDLAYGEDFRQGLGTPEPSEALTQAYSDSEDVSGYEPPVPRVGDRFKDRQGDMWTVVTLANGEPWLGCGLHVGRDDRLVTWPDLIRTWGPVIPWVDHEPETAPAPVQAPTTTPRTYTHEGVEYVYGVRYIDCEGEVWVIVDTLADGTPFVVASYQASDWPDWSEPFTMMVLPTLVLRYGPLEIDFSDPVDADARG